MRHLILISSIALLSLGQNGNNMAAGTWAAQFEGHTFLRLELRSEAGKLTGTLAGSDIQVDGQGAVRQVGGALHDPTPIFDVSQQGSTVTFSRKDGDDTDRFEFRVLDNARGELRLLLTDELRAELAADGVPPPKPFVLNRVPQLQP